MSVSGTRPLETADFPVLRVERVAKSFGGVDALKQVSLDLRSGEVRAICGENGAGKSTLVKIVTGLVEPDSGRIQLDGVDCLFSGARAAQAAGINLVTQELSVCPDLSVLDNIWLGTIGVPLFHKRSALRQMAKQVLAELGADTISLDTPLTLLSTGERQIVEIARMLNRNTRVLILDEPTATLSDQEIGRVFVALRAIRAAGKSILYITHRLPEVFALCDTATVLRNGEVVADCRVDSLDRKSLIEFMLGRPIGELYPSHKRPDEGRPVLSISRLRVPGASDFVDLDVRAGEIVCLTGQVGSGAEQVVRAVCGLVHDAEGTMRIDGKDVPLGAPEHSFDAGIRFVSGDRSTEGIFVDRTVADNLVATRLSRRSMLGFVNRRALVAEAGTLANAVQIDLSRLNAAAFELSGGNQQKIAFGRNLLDPDVKVLVMIEPTRGIDVGARAAIYRLMRDFCDQGYGVLVASTDFGEVLGLGDFIVTMYRGTIVGRHNGKDATMPLIVADVTHPVEQ